MCVYLVLVSFMLKIFFCATVITTILYLIYYSQHILLPDLKISNKLNK